MLARPRFLPATALPVTTGGGGRLWFRLLPCLFVAVAAVVGRLPQLLHPLLLPLPLLGDPRVARRAPSALLLPHSASGERL